MNIVLWNIIADDIQGNNDKGWNIAHMLGLLEKDAKRNPEIMEMLNELKDMLDVDD